MTSLQCDPNMWQPMLLLIMSWLLSCGHNFVKKNTNHISGLLTHKTEQWSTMLWCFSINVKCHVETSVHVNLTPKRLLCVMPSFGLYNLPAIRFPLWLIQIVAEKEMIICFNKFSRDYIVTFLLLYACLHKKITIVSMISLDIQIPYVLPYFHNTNTI